MQLDSLVSQTGLPVAATNVDGRMTLLSPALQRLLEMPFEEVDESDMAEHFGCSTATVRCRCGPRTWPLVRAGRGEIVTDAVVTTRTRQGRLLYLRCNAAPVRDRRAMSSEPSCWPRT